MTEQEKQASLAQVQGTLFNDVFVPAFVKLASDKGVNISTEAELEQALRIATAIEAQHAQQAPQDNAALLKQAADALEGVTSGKQTESELAYFSKQAAALPSVRQAVLTAAKLG